MNYPTYEIGDSRQVVSDYMQLIGAREPDNRNAIDALPPASLERAGLLVARACLILAESGSVHNQKAGNKILHRAGHDIEKMSPLLRGRKHRSARHLAITAAMLSNRNDAEALQTLRLQSHDEAIKSINSIHAAIRRAEIVEEQQLLGGELAEYVGLAMLTRLGAHPKILARPALPHHDENKTSNPKIRNSEKKGARRNIDLTLAETGIDDSEPQLHTVQVKSGCLGYCGNAEAYAEEVRTSQQRRYNSDISLVSKNCDMVMHPNGASPAYRPLSGFLQKEYQGTISAEEIRELDTATNGLLLVMTCDEPLRHGTLKAGNFLPQTCQGASPFQILAAASAS